MGNTKELAILKDRLEQIYITANMNEGNISYRVLVDTLKDKNSEITVEEISTIIDKISAEGISVIFSEEDEEYSDSVNTNAQDFIPAEVNITPRNITVDAIVDRLEHKEINLNPDFQRRGGLWSEKQQSQLIESLMLKIPLPTFYFDASKENEWVVIDGLQRLTAFKNFMVEKKLRLTGLEYLKEFENCSFEDLPRQYYRRIRETQITIYTVEKGTPDDVVFNIFKRINTGGLVLSPQEIRHALYQGPVTELITKLVQEDIFKQATTNSLSQNRMMDREYVTRFIAFTELDYHTEYKGNIDSFLTKALKQVNAYANEKEYERIYCNFIKIMKYCHLIFGRYAFRRVNTEYRRGPINKAIFELWSICFNELTDIQLNLLLEKKDILLEKFIDLLTDKEFATAIKAGDKYSLENRVVKTKRMLEGLLK